MIAARVMIKTLDQEKTHSLLILSSLVCVVSLSFAVIPGSALSRSSALELC